MVASCTPASSVASMVGANRGAFDWTVSTLSRAQIERLRTIAGPRRHSPAPLPESFADILQVLCRDGRASAAEVAAATGLAPTTARRRLQRIFDSGALVFRCDVAQAAAGFPLACQWHARLPVEKHREVARILRDCGALRLCASITGPSNFMFMFWLQNPAEVMDLERQLASRLPELRVTESTMISHIAKRMGWRLGAMGVRRARCRRRDWRGVCRGSADGFERPTQKQKSRGFLRGTSFRWT